MIKLARKVKRGYGIRVYVAVANQRDRDALIKEIEELLMKASSPQKAKAFIIEPLGAIDWG